MNPHDKEGHIDLRGKQLITMAEPYPQREPVKWGDTLFNVSFVLGGAFFVILLSALKGKSQEVYQGIFMFFRALAALVSVLLLNFDKIWPYALIGTFLLAFSWLAYVEHRKTRFALRITEINQYGLRLGRHGSHALSYFIFWKDIAGVETVRLGQDSRRGSLLIERSDDSRVYKLSLDNAFSWIGEEEFHTHVKAYAPAIQIMGTPASRMIPLAQKEVRYTDLWLEYFSTPATRKRKGDLAVGDTLNNGEYVITSKLTRGGQGTVYLAQRRAEPEAEHKSSHGPAVALKEYILPVHRGTLLAHWQTSALQEEARVLGAIDHRQIVKLLDLFVEDHRGYLVLEYVDGKSLRNLVKEEGSQSEEAVVRWARQLCAVLSYLHELSPPIIHRDITPDNLILQTDDSLKVIDFTIAHQLGSSRTATIAGKQAYTPPEQFEGKAEPASDIYALGATMYFLLTGEDPQPMSESSPCEKVSTITPELNAVVQRATSLHDRYKSAAQMAVDLATLE